MKVCFLTYDQPPGMMEKVSEKVILHEYDKNWTLAIYAEIVYVRIAYGFHMPGCSNTVTLISTP